jgi:hypothetical protein
MGGAKRYPSVIGVIARRLSAAKHMSPFSEACQETTECQTLHSYTVVLQDAVVLAFEISEWLVPVMSEIYFSSKVFNFAKSFSTALAFWEHLFRLRRLQEKVE